MNRKEQLEIEKDFPWGEPIEWMEIDPYTILKYHPWKRYDYRILKGQPDYDEVSFHGYLDGKDVHESWPTLETALAGLMGYKWAGNNNGGVGYYFCKMIDAPPYDEESKWIN